MNRGAKVALSANEETTLRRIDYGIAKTLDLNVADVAHLIRLNLVERIDDRLNVTALGKQQLAIIRVTSVPLATDQQVAQLFDKIIRKPSG